MNTESTETKYAPRYQVRNAQGFIVASDLELTACKALVWGGFYRDCQIELMERSIETQRNTLEYLIEEEDEEIRVCREEIQDISRRIHQAIKNRAKLSAQLAALGPAKEES